MANKYYKKVLTDKFFNQRSVRKFRSRLLPESASDVPETDPTCTLCGRVFADRQNFNAHIRMHLKEKLNIRREQVRTRLTSNSLAANDNSSLAAHLVVTVIKELSYPYLITGK